MWSPANFATRPWSDPVVEQRDQRTAAAVGRDARLELTFAYRNGRTVLAEAYAEPPFRVGRCFPEGEALHMILASSAPGAFGRDYLRQVIRLERGAHVRLTSQSALQVHPTPDDTVARLFTAYQIGDDARLHCQWDPLIPFAGARVDQRIDVSIADSGYLYWSDALMSGRQARGERWLFTSLAHELIVSRANALEYLERYRIDASDRDVFRAWMAGGASYLGTALATGQEIEQRAADRLHAELGAITGVRAAVDRLESRVLLVRLVGTSGPPFHEARLRVGRALASTQSPQ